MSSDHRELMALIPGYALGALDPDELARVERHILDCAECQSALADFAPVVDGLLTSPPPVGPPRRLRQRLRAELDRSAGPRKARGAGRAWIPAILGAALLVVNGVLFLQTRSLQAQAERLSESAWTGQVAVALDNDPDSRVAPFAGETAQGMLLYHPARSTAVLQAWGLAPLADDQTYQLWLIEADGRRISGAVFRPDADEALVSVLVRAPRSLGEFAGFGVTIEPAPGSQAPTGPRVLGSELR